MDIYFSTVFRYAPIDQAGELVRLDWDTKKVISKVPVAPRSLHFEDPNPRGNSRGGKGIALIDDKIIVAGYCELQVYDRNLNHLYDISHNLMSGLHEVYHETGSRLWITSTVLNSALLIDVNNRELLDAIWPQECIEFKNRWNLTPMQLDKSADNRIRFLAKNIEKDPSHLHFNAIYKWKGDMYGLFNRFGAVVNLTRQRIVFEDRSIYGAHNLIILDDGTIFVNDTRNQAVNLYGKDGALKKRINLLPFHQANRKVRRYKQLNGFRKMMTRIGFPRQDSVMPFFVRGLDLSEDLLFIGISPAAILCVNWQTGKLVDVFNYTDDVRVAVHGLHIA